MDASTLLRTARIEARLTQVTLGRRAHLPQPRISEIERGETDPGFGRLVELVRASGHTLVLLPTRTPPVADAADDIRSYLESGNDRHALRRFIQLSDDLAREPAPVRIGLACTPPLATGHAGYDAALAALVEYHAPGLGAVLPLWVFGDDRVCEDGWSPATDPALVKYARARAPEPFRRRGVFISVDDLTSV